MATPPAACVPGAWALYVSRSSWFHGVVARTGAPGGSPEEGERVAALLAAGAQPSMPGAGVSGQPVLAAASSTTAALADGQAASGGGAADAAAGGDAVQLLQQLIEVLTKILAMVQAQEGVGQLGGPAPAVTTLPDVSALPGFADPVVIDPTGTVQPVLADVTGGGGAAAAPAPAAATPSATTGDVAVTGAEARRFVDARFITGPEPAAGSLVDAILNHGSTSVMQARTEEGVWRWVMDSSGSGVFTHVHGALASLDDAALLAAIRSGQGMVHIHPNDGSVHIHDM